MSTLSHYEPFLPLESATIMGPQWYALHTKARHEKTVVRRLSEYGIETYLPLSSEIHRWSDRTRKIEVPLFSCYVFVRTILSGAVRVKILSTAGVFGVVGVRGYGTIIPDSQIANIRQILASASNYTTYPFLAEGQRVRVRGGALDGIEGVFQHRNDVLVLSIDALHRSLAISVEGYHLEPVCPSALQMGC